MEVMFIIDSCSYYDLVEIHDSDLIKVDMQYHKLGMDNAIDKCYLMRKVYERLKIASTYLPDGYSLVILDAYRPIELQKELFDKYSIIIEKKFHLENYSEDDKNNFFNKFVSIPDKDNPPAHTTGGAVDVTLLYNWKYLNLGCNFDEFCDRTYTNYYKDNKDLESIKIHKHRMILYNSMIKAGFTNLETEYWHYDYGDKNWSDITGNDVLYNEIIKL